MSITISSQDRMPVSYSYGPSPYLAPVEHRILNLQKTGKTEMQISNELNLSSTEVFNRLEAIKRKINSKGDVNNFGATEPSSA